MAKVSRSVARRVRERIAIAALIATVAGGGAGPAAGGGGNPPGSNPPDPAAPFVLGTTMPDANNTGPQGAMLSTVTGSLSAGLRKLTITTAGAYYYRVRFECVVDVKAANVHFEECDLVADQVLGVGPQQRAVVSCTNAAALGTRFTRCYGRPTVATNAASAMIQGHRYTTYRCNWSGTEDGLAFSSSSLSSTDNVVEGDYIHDLVFWKPTLDGRSEGSHNDCIQHHNASGHKGNLVYGCQLSNNIDQTRGEPGEADNGIHGYSCLMFAPQGTGTVWTGTYQYNWLKHGEVGFNCGSWSGSGHAVHIDYNRFYTATLLTASAGVIKSSGMHFTGSSSLTGNVNIDGAGVSTPFTAGTFAGTWP